MTLFERASAEHERRKLFAWNRATVIPRIDPSEWREDGYGRRIRFSDYGNRDSQYGWTLDYIRPLAEGGADADRNLQAVHWRTHVGRARKRRA